VKHKEVRVLKLQFLHTHLTLPLILTMKLLATSTILIIAATAKAIPASNAIVSIPPELTYLLPPRYSSELQAGFVNTNTTNKSYNDLLASAAAAPFISYSQEFLDILGPNPTLKLIAERTYAFAGEAGVWAPDRNEVWFTSNTNGDAHSLEVLDLATSKIRVAQTSLPILNPNGGTYFNKTVYITSGGTLSNAPCIYAINPSTGHTTILLNSYFGLSFNGPNDLAWATGPNKKPSLFFTDDPISIRYAPGSPLPAQLPDAVWRFDPETHALVPVISRADILIPNGIRTNAASTKLYITDSSATDAFPTLAGGAAGTGSPAVYVYDLDAQMFPTNRRMIGLARTGVPDGLHIDDKGNIWTAEYEGVVVRNHEGRVLGLFNSQAYGVNATTYVANFALAGDVLIILDVGRVWGVKLGSDVVAGK
jgi:gluconolactonase